MRELTLHQLYCASIPRHIHFPTIYSCNLIRGLCHCLVHYLPTHICLLQSLTPERISLHGHRGRLHQRQKGQCFGRGVRHTWCVALRVWLCSVIISGCYSLRQTRDKTRLSPATAEQLNILNRVGEYTLTDEQWKSTLGPDRYSVLRKAGTERPFSSALNSEKRTGTFVCAGCGAKLFSSDTKYNSGTGWPSFYTALPGAVDEVPDNSIFFMPRTEVRSQKSSCSSSPGLRCANHGGPHVMRPHQCFGEMPCPCTPDRLSASLLLARRLTHVQGRPTNTRRLRHVCLGDASRSTSIQLRRLGALTRCYSTIAGAVPPLPGAPGSRLPGWS